MEETNHLGKTSQQTIPEGWREFSLGELGEVKMCKRVMKYQTLATGDIPFYKIGTFGGTPDAYISRELFTDFRSRFSYPKKGDILLSAAGTIGRTAVFDGEDSYFQDSNIVWIDNKEDKVLNSFLYYCYKVMKFHTENGGIVVRLYNENLRNTTFYAPESQGEQKKIANALSAVDNMIGALDEAIAKKRQIKEGLIQQLMTGKTRLPGFSGEWREAELKEFGYMIRGVSYKPEDSSLKPEDGYVRLLRSNNIQEGKMVYADYVFVKSANIADYQYMKDGDILICMANGSKQLVGKAARLTRSGVYTFGAFMGVFRCNDKTVCPFVEELLKTGYYRKLLDDILTGSAINNLNGAAVESLKFFVPSDSQEQRAIAAVLCKADDEINGLECQHDKYRLIKQGMMQELLTGKTRL